jgi:magnesium chelatase subunit D
VRTHRAEIVVARTAKTIAAFDGRREVTMEDIKEAMELALPHRMRRKPFEQPFLEKGKIEAVMSMSNPDKNPDEPEEKHKPGHGHEHKGEREQNSSLSSDYNSESDNPLKEKETTTIFDIGSPIDVSELKTPQGDKKYRRKIAGMTRTSEKR